ncbi:hypothetical protein H9X96_03165 [Pedobacter sp. N36a]|uniref:hypothetical protein n=1 Tax=Pedobacter sp. N36a TaxID=2767996 RepID=UPI001657560B|nr:hypothetical protein [Pedobacter sp. N36a]MBC8984770.1 hypothetical protein [Pedobacter sp. N36a]
MIKPNFTRQDIRRAIGERLVAVDRAIVLRLAFIGETFVNNARLKNTYMDQSGALRSSIGYVVLKNGVKRLGSDFVKVKNGEEGVAAGKKLIKELLQAHPTGYVLIVVAGMNYAAAVESKGKDVLTGSIPETKRQLRAAFKDFNR